MRIKIRKSNLYMGVCFSLYVPFLARLLTDNYGMTYVIMPVFDLILLSMMILIFYFYPDIPDRDIKTTWLIFGMLFLIAILSIVANGGTSFSDFFYQIRPYLRMSAMVVVASYIVRIRNLEKIYLTTKHLLYINVIVMIVQFFAFGLRQDIIGGTFGNTRGVNAIQNILCVFVFTISLVKYFYKEIELKILITDIVMVLIVTILAEINFLLFEMALISVTAYILYKRKRFVFSVRKILFILVGLVVAFLGTGLFLRFNPDRVFLLSPTAILDYIGAKGGTGVYRISRVGVFSQLGKTFFGKDIAHWMLGFGVGNCSTHTEFYNLYSYLQYTNFSSSCVFLESGLVGVIGNLSIYFIVLIRTIKQRKKCILLQQTIWNDACIIFALISIGLFFYNSSLRDTYTAFWIGLFCAIGFVVRKEG